MSLTALRQAHHKRYLERKRDQKLWLHEIILKRRERNFDTRTLVLGEGGIGKSWWSLRNAEGINPEIFHDEPQQAVDENVHFLATDYLDAVKGLDTEVSWVIVFDEPGQEWFARAFMSQTNMILAKVMIGQRYRKLCSFFTVPYLSLIDKVPRTLCQLKCDVLRRGHAEVYKINPAKFEGPTYYKRLGTFDTKKPRRKLRHAYEKKKAESQDALYERFGYILKEQEKETTTLSEYVDKVLEDPKAFMTPSKFSAEQVGIMHGDPRLHIPTLQSKLDIGQTRAYTVRARAEERIDYADYPGS